MILATKFLLIAVLSAFICQTEAQSCDYYQQLEPGQTYYLYNPEYPDYSQGERHCQWQIRAQPGTTVLLNCSIEHGGNQCSNSLKIVGVPDNGPLCSPFTSESTNEKVNVTFSLSYTQSAKFLCSAQTRSGCSCGYWDVGRRGRILGGEETGVNQFPFMVSLVNIRLRRHACGGTIISSRYILTSAGCLENLSTQEIAVVAGEHDFTTGSETNATAIYRVRRIVRHPLYMPIVFMNDIAIIQVEGSIRFSSRVGPVCLPFGKPGLPQVGERVTALGWGGASLVGGASNVLMKTTIPTVPIQRCQSAYPMQPVNNNSQFCTFERGKDTCIGDSGGPLLSISQSDTAFISGIISSQGSDCTGDVPSVRTRVYAYLDWIKTASQENFCMK